MYALLMFVALVYSPVLQDQKIGPAWSHMADLDCIIEPSQYRTCRNLIKKAKILTRVFNIDPVVSAAQNHGVLNQAPNYNPAAAAFLGGIRSQLFKAVLNAKPIWHSKPNRGFVVTGAQGLGGSGMRA